MGNWPSAYFIGLFPTRKPQSSSICEALQEGGGSLIFKKKRACQESIATLIYPQYQVSCPVRRQTSVIHRYLDINLANKPINIINNKNYLF